MIDQVIATDPAAMQSQQVAVETADDGGQIAGVLHGIGVRGGFVLNWIGPVGDGGFL